MPDYCSHVLSVDLLTTDEELVLATSLEIDRPPDGRRVDDIFDGWNIPSEIPYYVASTPRSRRFCWSGSRTTFPPGLRLRATVLSLLDAFLIVVPADKSSCGLITC